MAELLNRIAFDENKNIVFVENALKGKNYFCPECNGRFVYKNSGKTGPGTKRPHFAHQSDVSNCSPETILHASFKIKAAELLSERIAKGENFPIEWTCPQCNGKYPYNILFMAKKVQVEHDLKECRPDIALLDADGNAIAVIEVVVSHAPEENTLKYYHENGIVLVQYNVKETDLLDIEEKLKHPDVVSLCLNNKCNNYNANAVMRVPKTHKQKCVRCQHEYDVYSVIVVTSIGGAVYDFCLTPEELQAQYAKDPKQVRVRNSDMMVWRSKCACMPTRVIRRRTDAERAAIAKMERTLERSYSGSSSRSYGYNSRKRGSYKKRR